MAGSGAAYSSSSNSTALSLVGALRRLGTRVNLVPVNFSSDSSRCGCSLAQILLLAFLKYF
jgi:hypothetical protein